MFTKRFWMNVAERVAEGVAVAALVAIGITSNTDAGFDVLATDWTMVGSYAAGAAVVVLLKSLGSRKAGDDPESGSLVKSNPDVHEVEVDEASLDEDFWVNDKLPEE